MKQFDNFGQKDRRTAIRWYGEMPTEFVTFSDMIIPDNPKKTKGVIRDLSIKGFRAIVEGISTDDEEALLKGVVKVGIIVKFENITTPVKAIGKVVWMKDSSQEGSKIMGVEIVSTTSAAEDAIKNHIINFYIN